LLPGGNLKFLNKCTDVCSDAVFLEIAKTVFQRIKPCRGENMLAMQIEEEALKLDPIEKAHLAELLLISLDRPDPEIEKKWVKESEQRYAAYKRGEIQGIPLDQFTPRLSK
jgi:hypothetical protein